MDESYQTIAHEIIAMSETDQAMRTQAIHKSDMWDESIDVKNTQRMKEIVTEIGWPTISKVGSQASYMAWLLVQHADLDNEFQQFCLALMKVQPANEVNRQNIAYLEDRVRIHQGQPQIYGTQFYTDEQGELVPRPIEDLENVDKRRAEVGLNTLAEYTADMKSL